ncbi:hypothetical protein GDO86_002292 [Hymenochirus boettgeri]|uniref:Myb-like domain-containing protein n=1 Tax=Hymenochirus boettgeri TaxID=247094 RepID=A0A8T2KPE5_9PIPI|nr:hypothetical protein GDO86_002292 [Hymenochirus boettgeri]
MIRRARLSIKPNVKPGGRGPSHGTAPGSSGTGREPSEVTQTSLVETPRNDIGVSACEVPDVPEPMNSPAPVDPLIPGEDRKPGLCINTPAACTEIKPERTSATPPQRRKRFATLPNLAKPRTSISSAVTTSQQQTSNGETPEAVPTICTKIESLPDEKPKHLSSSKSPTLIAPSQQSLPEKRTPGSQVSQFPPFKLTAIKLPELGPMKPELKDDLCPLKERPSQKSHKDDEFLRSTKSTSAKKNIGNLEKERLQRSQKIRDLLKEELKKERTLWKNKNPIKCFSSMPERSKMTMRDLIYYIPQNNPMSSSFDENKTPEKLPPVVSQNTGGEMLNNPRDEEDDLDENEDDGPLLVPRVKVAEDGSIILDEESLTVEVSRTKGAVVENDDPIFERGSTTTYSSFRRNKYSKPWSEQESELFFLAISMVGTDFSMIAQLFPHRERIEIKNKFKREERMNSWRIDKAFTEKQAFDVDFFSTLLKKALAEAANKQRAPKGKKQQEKTPKPRKRRKGKSNEGENNNLGDQEGEAADSRTAEKENEETQSVTESASEPLLGKKKKARKKKNDPQLAKQENLSQSSTKKSKNRKKNKVIEGATVDDLESADVKAKQEDCLEKDKSQAGHECAQKTKKPRRKKKPNTEGSDADSHSANVPEHPQSVDNSSGRKEPIVRTNELVELCEAPEGDASLVSSEGLTGAQGLQEPFEDDIELFSIHGIECESDGEDSFMPLTSDVSLFDQSSISVDWVPVENKEMCFETNDSMVSIGQAKKSHDLAEKNPEEPEAQSVDSSASQEGSTQIPINPSHLKQGRSKGPVSNLANVSNERKEREEKGDVLEKSTEISNIPEKNSSEENSCEDKTINGTSQETTKSQVGHILSPTPSPIKAIPVGKGRLQKQSNLAVTSSRRGKQEDRGDAQDKRMEAPIEDPACKIQSSETDTSDPTKEHIHPEDKALSGDKEKQEKKQEKKEPGLDEISLKEDASMDQGGSETKILEISASPGANLQPLNKSAVSNERNLQRSKPFRSIPPGTAKQKDTQETQEAKSEVATKETINSTPQRPQDETSTPGNISITPSETSQKDSPSEDQGKSGDMSRKLSSSPAVCVRSPSKVLPFRTSRFQRPKPNLAIVSKRTGKQEGRGDVEGPTTSASKEETIEIPPNLAHYKNIDPKMAGDKHEVFTPSAPPSASLEDPGHELSKSAIIEEKDMETSGTVLGSVLGTRKDKEIKSSPAKSLPLIKSKLLRPKPNLGSSVKRKKEVKETVKGEPNEQSKEDTAQDWKDDVSVGKSENHQVKISLTEEGSDSPATPSSPKQSCPEKTDHGGPIPTVETDCVTREKRPEDPVRLTASLQMPSPKEQNISSLIKPTLLPRNRFQRPKPNIGKFPVRKGNQEGPEDVQKCEVQYTDAEPVPSITHLELDGSTLPSAVQPESVPESASLNLPSKESEKIRRQEPLKPVVLSRGRFQRPKPNIGRAVAKREVLSTLKADGERIVTAADTNKRQLKAESPLISTSKDEPNIDSKASEELCSSVVVKPTKAFPTPGNDLNLSKDTSSDQEHAAQIKSAPLKRGRFAIPKPNLLNASSRRGSQGEGSSSVQTKPPKQSVVHCPLTETKGDATDVLLESQTKKRKVEDQNRNNLPPKRCSIETADMPACLSGIEGDLEPLEGDGLESSLSCGTRFSRRIKNSLPSRTPAQTKPPEKVLEKSKNGQSSKTSSNIKVVKPVARKGTTLVKLRASRWEDKDDENEDEISFKDEREKVRQRSGDVTQPTGSRKFEHSPLYHFSQAPARDVIVGSV